MGLIMLGILKALFGMLVAQTAPFVTLAYRKGWFLTPDDSVSPYGRYESSMVEKYEKWGAFWADWWWLGMRNRAYGLAYAQKPDHFKRMRSYADDVLAADVRWHGPLRITTIDGYSEYMLTLGLVHLIAGYRLRPVSDEILRAESTLQWIQVRPINMDARPILSIRAGKRDD